MSRVLFPESTKSSAKATFRPGKAPFKRNDSTISLPSPPMEPSYLSPPTEVETFSTNGNLNGNREGEGSSPTQVYARKGRRVDKDRIVVDKIIGKEQVLGMGEGWEEVGNPFIERVGEGEKRSGGGRERGVKPEKMTYVFRGKRITYDFPLDSLLAQDPGESPFPIPSPRLLFPAPPTTPPSSNCSSSFLNALRTAKRGAREVDHGLPTPVREREGKKFKASNNEDTRMR